MEEDAPENYTRQGARLGVLTFPEAKPIRAGIVVRVGEQTISSMGLSIFCWFGQRVTAGWSSRGVWESGLAGNWGTSDKRGGLVPGMVSPGVSVRVWMEECVR